MTGLVTRLRRRLRPVRRFYRRVRARRPAPAVSTGGGRVEHVRRVAQLARARGDVALARDALLELVAAQAATVPELRQLRRHAAGRPAPAAPAPPARPGLAGARPAPPGPHARPDLPAPADPPNGSGPLLVVDRDAGGALRATVWAADGTAEVVPDAWRPGWVDLPPALADQLAVGVLTREAVRRRVASVAAAEPLGSAIALGAGLLDRGAAAAPTGCL